jgi:hypothetical protein
LLALIFDQSRKPHFRCELCGTTFSSHTIRSRLLFDIIDSMTPNQSPEPIGVDVCSFRFDVAVAAWLSSGRQVT